MTSRYLNLVFTPAVKAAQERNGSRDAYARRDSATEPDRLTDQEAAFIAARDSFFMATVSATGWPYIQHRGGPRGFVKVIDDRTLGLADFRGNRQYVSVGNLSGDDRAALIFIDHAQRGRLKVLGRVRAVDLATTPELAALLIDATYGARVERGLIIEIEAFDWNCPQHIVPRYTLEEITPIIDGLKAQIAALKERAPAP